MYGIKNTKTQEYFTGRFFIEDSYYNSAIFDYVSDGYIACWTNKERAQEYLETLIRLKWTCTPSDQLVIVEV